MCFYAPQKTEVIASIWPWGLAKSCRLRVILDGKEVQNYSAKALMGFERKYSFQEEKIMLKC